MPAPVLQFKRGNAGVAGTVPALRPGEPAISLNNFDFFVGIDTSVANNKFFGSHRYWGREDGTTSLRLKLVDKDGTNGVHLKAPNSLSGIGTYTLPSTNTIVDGYFLKVATDGTLSWDTVGGSNGSFLNPTLTGITTISGTYFDVNTNSDFSGITTFSNTTDNILGDSNTGSVQIDGGLGVDKNVTIGAGLSVGGESYFIGTATFYGGQINLGDSNTDNIQVQGEFVSSLVPNTNNTYDLGTDSKRWKDAYFGGNVNVSGVLTATTANFTNLSGTLTGTISTATRALTVDTVTASDTAANYYVTFVNSHNGSATAETVYTDDGIYYNPGTNTFTTQYGYFTGNVTVDGTITGTATTATRATLVDTTGTSDNNAYYVTFVDTSGGQTSETLRVGTALSINASTGNVKSAGDLIAGSGYLAAADGTRAMYMYGTSGDVSFQGKVVANNFRSSTNSNNTLTFSDLDATFARNLNVVGVTTVGSLTIGTGVAVTQFTTSVSSGSSTSSVPTSSAIIDYVGSQIGNVDLTLGINADTGGPSTVNTSQTLTISGTANEVETSVSGQTITVGLPDAVVVGTSLSAPTIRTGTIQSTNTGATAITIAANDVTIADDLTVNGNLYVNGNTTQVNTTTLNVKDALVDLGLIDSGGGVLVQPSSDLNKDIGFLLNYFTDSAKKAAVFWDDSEGRIVFADDVTESTGVLTVASNAYASIEIESLWVNDCAGQSQVITCNNSERFLQNITVDAGTF